MNYRVLIALMMALLLVTSGLSVYYYSEYLMLQTIIEDCEKGRDEVEYEVQDLGKQMVRLQREMADTTLELNAQRRKLATMQQQLVDARAKINYLAKSGQINKQKAEELTRKLDEYEQRIRSLIPESETIEEALASLVNIRQLERAESLNKVYQEQINDFEYRLDKLGSENDELREKLQHTSTQLETQTQYTIRIQGKYSYKKGKRKIIRNNRKNKVPGDNPLRIYFDLKPRPAGNRAVGLSARVTYEFGEGRDGDLPIHYDNQFDEYYVEVEEKTKGRVLFYNDGTEMHSYAF